MGLWREGSMTRGLVVAIGAGAVVVWMVFVWNEKTEAVEARIEN